MSDQVVAGELVPVNTVDPERSQVMAEIAAAVASGGMLAPQTIATSADVYRLWLSGRSATTLRAYARDLQDFAEFLGLLTAEAAIEAISLLSAGQANRIGLSYRNHLVGRSLAPATVARRLSALKSVVKMLRTLGRVNWSIEVDAPKVQAYRDTAGPGDDGWRNMAAEAKASAEDGPDNKIRDRAIVTLLHDLALRRFELTGLDLEHVEGDGSPTAIWIRGKGRKQRERLTLPKSTARALGKWIDVRGSFPGPLFVRLDKGALEPTRLTDTSVYRIVRALGAKAGVKRGARPHGLRHQGITAALDACPDLRKVRSYSRHARLDTLQKYDDNRKDFAGEVGRLVAGDDEE